MTLTTIDTPAGSATMVDQETRGEQHVGNGLVRTSLIENAQSGIWGFESTVKAVRFISHSVAFAHFERRFVMRKQ